MKKIKNRVISFILVLSMLFTLSPMIVSGADLSNEEVPETLDNEVVSNDTPLLENNFKTDLNELFNGTQPNLEKDVFIIAEDVTKRNEFEKHYFCSDGTFTVVTYPEAVHYMDENGKWVDIDNSFVLNATDGTYQAQNEDFSVSFSQNIVARDLSEETAYVNSTERSFEQTKLVVLKKGNHSISWTLNADKDTNATISVDTNAELMGAGSSTLNTETSKTLLVNANAQILGTVRTNDTANENAAFIGKSVSDESAFALENVSNIVEYDSVFGENEGISVKYTVFHNKIEEDIFIEKKTDIKSFSMSIDCGDLEPMLNADNSVDFLDENGDVIYHISIPYMIDAENAVLNDIEVILTKTDGQCIITYVPNAEWLNSEERVYPIMLDPSVTTNEYSASISDTYVEQNSSVSNANKQSLYITPNGSNIRKIVISLDDLPSIDPTMPIYNAVIGFNVEYVPFQSIPVKLEVVECPTYLIDNVTYSILADSSKRVVAHSSILTSGTYFSFDITDYLDELYSGELSGMFAMSMTDEASTVYCDPIHSMESTETDLRPSLTIKYGYCLPEALNNGQTIVLQNFGHGGYIYISETNAIVKSFNSVTDINAKGRFAITQSSETGGYIFEQGGAGSSKKLTVGLTANVADNVTIQSGGTASQTEWLIVPDSMSEFRIVLRSDMSKALAAVGSGTDGSSDTSLTSIGNVIVQNISLDQSGNSIDVNQQWTLYTTTGTLIDPDYPSVDIASGEYYLNNTGTGKFLYIQGNTVTAHSALTYADIDLENAKWYITNLGDNMYTIQNGDDYGEFLAIKTDGATLELANYNGMNSAEIPDRYIWELNWTSSQAGYTLVNKAYSKRVYATDSGLTTGVSSTTATNDYLWRFCVPDIYVPVTINNVSFDDFTVDIKDTANDHQRTASINKMGVVTYTSETDFTYTILTGSSYISVDNETGKFTAINPGDALVRATHKVTGVNFHFNVKATKSAIIIVPGYFGSELFLGEATDDFNENDHLLTTEIVNAILSYNPMTEWDQIANDIRSVNPTNNFSNGLAYANAFVDAMECTNEGYSEYNVYTKKYDPERTQSNDEYTLNCGMMNMYAGLFDYLYEAETGLNAKYTVEFFSYDWRLSSSISAAALNAFINEAGYNNVVLVAHSFGGLVTSGYLAMGEEQRNKVDDVFMLASPLLGTPIVLNIWANNDFTIVLDDNTQGYVRIVNCFLSIMNFSTNALQELISNYKSVYEAFPTERYFAVAGRPFLVYYKYFPITDSISITECSYSTTNSIISSHLSFFDNTLMDHAIEFHNSCYENNQHITSLVDTHYIYAITTEEDGKTLTQMKFSETFYGVTGSNPNFAKSIEENAGDSVVPYWSATLGLPENSENVDLINGNHMDAIDPNYVGQYIYSRIISEEK